MSLTDPCLFAGPPVLAGFEVKPRHLPLGHRQSIGGLDRQNGCSLGLFIVLDLFFSFLSVFFWAGFGGGCTSLWPMDTKRVGQARERLGQNNLRRA